VPDEDPHGLGNVLEVDRAEVGELQLGPPVEVLVHPLGDSDPAWRRDRLHANREIHARAVEVVAGDKHVGQHDAGAHLEEPAARNAQVPLMQLLLHVSDPFDCRDHALEFG